MGYEQPIVADPSVEGPVRHKLTVDEFMILDEAGVFPSKHVELIDGEIFVLSPIYQPHSRTLSELTIEVGLALRKLGGSLRSFTPVSTRIDDFNLPLPDLMVAEEDGGDRFLSPASVRLVIEVSSSTLRHDLVMKAKLYAGAGLPEYWVADVHGRRIVRMHRPVEGQYSERAEFAFGQLIASATVEGLVIETTTL